MNRIDACFSVPTAGFTGMPVGSNRFFVAHSKRLYALNAFRFTTLKIRQL